MRFSDYVVDYALQVNTQSLHALTGADQLRPRVVHGLRVNVKRLRAAWQLLNCVADDDAREIARGRLKSIHKALAPSRDFDVVAETARRLEAKATKKKLKRALRRLADEIGQPCHGALDIDGLNRGFQEESRCWRELGIAGMADDDLIAKGFGKAYRTSRRLGERARNGAPDKLLEKASDNAPDNASEVLHRWRRQTKYTLYQLEVIKPVLTGPNLERRLNLSRLGDRLGKYQDLCMLEGAVRRSGLQAGDRARIDRFVAERKTVLVARSVKLYDCLYGRKTSAFITDVRRDIDRLALNNVIMLPRKIG
ncbi:MAG: CHAD domain-containing protein [Gammaproteobacteria bacterium]|nr:CHAD domain-containing protein [Gammaproteobacteria bacterium]